MIPKTSHSRHLRRIGRSVLSRFYSRAVHPTLKRMGLRNAIRELLLRPYVERPPEVDIEITSACNADCIMCPRRAMRRRQGAMDFALFKKIVDEAVAMGVKKLGLNGYGEISVLPNYRDYLSYVRSKSSSIGIHINSNGMRVDEAMAEFLVRSRVDVINVTIDGSTAETYEAIRRNLRLDAVQKNVRRLIEIRDALGTAKPLVAVSMLEMPQNRDEREAFQNTWSGVADRTFFLQLSSRNNGVDWVTPSPTPNWEPCFELWNRLVIYSDGAVALCCDDWDARGEMGNAKTTSLLELWRSQEREHLRYLHLTDRAGEHPICGDCKEPRKGPVWLR